MNYEAVIGLGFGDCGKGIVTDYLCAQSLNPLVVRFSGGQQAGHTVYFNDKKHVFSNFGSGTLRGIPTYWLAYCTIDPIGIVNELNCLLEKEINPLLYINEKCPVTTPYDMFYNQETEKVNNHGTCGVGVGATIEREENKYSLTFGDLFYPRIFGIKLDFIKKYYKIECNISLDKFLKCCELITTSKFIKIVEEWPLKEKDNSFADIIFEGSQGLLLDQDYGFFPNVTRSNTGSKNIEIYQPWFNLVTRAYQTRHGIGPLTNEDLIHNIKDNLEETNIRNQYQGEFRKTLLDLDLLEYGINKDYFIKNTNKKSLFITCLDHIENEWRFTYKRKIIYCDNENDFIERISTILNIKNIYISKSPYSENIKLFK